jgi:hypothetical protein
VLPVRVALGQLWVTRAWPKTHSEQEVAREAADFRYTVTWEHVLNELVKSIITHYLTSDWPRLRTGTMCW